LKQQISNSVKLKVKKKKKKLKGKLFSKKREFIFIQFPPLFHRPKKTPHLIKKLKKKRNLLVCKTLEILNINSLYNKDDFL
jgi:uncharacterized protein YecE (DUF72 family)